jgi:hypothetical protein
MIFYLRCYLQMIRLCDLDVFKVVCLPTLKLCFLTYISALLKNIYRNTIIL